MSIPEIEEKITNTIDQYYSFGNREYIEMNQLQFIGGVLQTALHLLPTERYYAVKRYVYDRHGYDAGGVSDGQVSITDMIM